MKHGGAWQGGFAMLEVLVAMTIVALGVVTVVEVFSTGLRLGSRSADQTEAMTYGRQVMDDFLVTTKLDQGSEQGSLQERSLLGALVQLGGDEEIIHDLAAVGHRLGLVGAAGA